MGLERKITLYVQKSLLAVYVEKWDAQEIGRTAVFAVTDGTVKMACTSCIILKHMLFGLVVLIEKCSFRVWLLAVWLFSSYHRNLPFK